MPTRSDLLGFLAVAVSGSACIYWAAMGAIPVSMPGDVTAKRAEGPGSGTSAGLPGSIPPLASFEAVWQKQLFRPNSVPETVVPEKPLQAPVIVAEPVPQPKRELPVELAGILYSREFKKAVLRNRNDGSRMHLGVGDTMGDARVTAVHERSVEIEFDGVTHLLELPDPE